MHGRCIQRAYVPRVGIVTLVVLATSCQAQRAIIYILDRDNDGCLVAKSACDEALRATRAASSVGTPSNSVGAAVSRVCSVVCLHAALSLLSTRYSYTPEAIFEHLGDVASFFCYV